MTLTRLKLVHFRGYQNLELGFEPGMTAILGRNGAGKTNLAEAIYFLSLARSWRCLDDRLLIQNGESLAYIEADVSEGNFRRTIEIEIGKQNKKIRINGKPIRKLSELSRLVNVISFAPEDVSLFTGSPKLRRSFLDASLSKFDGEYLDLIIQSNRLLHERNAALKAQNVDPRLLDAYDEQLARLAEPIVEKRTAYVARLNGSVSKTLSALRKDEATGEIIYRSFLPLGEDFQARALALYRQARDSDLLYRSTSLGIHREDFQFLLRGKDVAHYGSQGENRLCALALELAPYDLIEDPAKKPICVLDDVTSELDEIRVRNLMALLQGYSQVFLTATELDYPAASIVEVGDHQAIRR